MPALPFAMGLSAGIAVSFLGTVPWWIALIVALTGLCLRRYRRFGIPSLTVGVAVGLVSGTYNRPEPVSPEIFDGQTEITGRVVDVRPTALTTRIVVDIDSTLSAPAEGRIVINYHGAESRIRPGTEIAARGKVYPLDEAVDLPYQTDYNRYLFVEGISGRMSIYSHSDLTIVSNENRGWWNSFSDSVRRGWLAAIVDAGFNEQTTAFILAAIGGDDYLLDKSLEDRFRDNGLAHLLAISGMHLAIVVLIMSWLVYFLKFTLRTRRFYFVLLMLAVVLYAVAVGLRPSVCRSALMALVMLGCGLFEVRPNPFQALAVSVSVCLLVSPVWIFSPGFQLSVVAVVGLLTLGRVTSFVPPRLRFIRFLVDLMVLPVVALAATSLLTIFYFHSIPLNFWLANVVAALFVPVLISLGFLSVLVSLLGIPAGLLTTLTDWIYRLMNGAVSGVDSIGASPVPVFLTATETIVLGLAVVALAVLILRPRRVTALIAGSAALMAAVVMFITDREIPEAELYIPRHSLSTDILLIDGGRSYVWTISPATKGSTTRDEFFETNYRDFFRHRRVTLPADLPEDYDGTKVTRHGAVLTVDTTRIGVLMPGVAVPAGRYHYMLVSDRYGEDLDSCFAGLQVDSVLLPRRMHYKRFERFSRQLEELGIPFRRLDDRPLAISVRTER